MTLLLGHLTSNEIHSVKNALVIQMTYHHYHHYHHHHHHHHQQQQQDDVLPVIQPTASKH